MNAITQQTKEQLPVNIRKMFQRDVSEVLGIELQSFDFAWQKRDFLRCLHQKSNCGGIIAERIADRKDILGFMIYKLYKSKSKLHILNFAVDPACRRQGIGSQMVTGLVNGLSFYRRTKIILELRETNLPAQLFFRGQSFRATGIIKNYYYQDTREDAYLMEYQDGNSKKNALKIIKASEYLDNEA